jgi:hypothetical protein
LLRFLALSTLERDARFLGSLNFRLTLGRFAPLSFDPCPFDAFLLCPLLLYPLLLEALRFEPLCHYGYRVIPDHHDFDHRWLWRLGHTRAPQRDAEQHRQPDYHMQQHGQ